MKPDSAPQLINQLIAIHARSLPVYLSDAAPYATAKHAHATDVVNMIAADHLLTVDKMADALIEQNQAVSMGAFPAEFTGYHDLSIDYLLSELVRRQSQEVKLISSVVEQLADDPADRPLAEEALGAAKGHLESLEELARGVAV